MDLQATSSTHRLTWFGAFVVGIIFAAAAWMPAEAGKSKPDVILHTFFLDGADGIYPRGGLLADSDGNLYGTTIYGGRYDYGTIFKIAPDGTETILHSFANDGADGVYPVAGLIMDSKANLYGTTNGGGKSGYGTVFRLNTKGAETVLYSFVSNGTDGIFPYAKLAIDKHGNFFGTTARGGRYGGGTIFKLTAKGAESALYSFASYAGDAAVPYFEVTLDKKGNLYGSTQSGGQYGGGAVFKVTKDGAETLLHSFNADGVDGYGPLGGVILDKDGNIYGSTAACGSGYANCGIIFKLAPNGTETILFTFPGDFSKGGSPQGTLVADKKGDLYGGTLEGGNGCAGGGCGVVFKVTPEGKQTVLHAFAIDGSDGLFPNYGVIFGPDGNLFGTTQQGGQYDYGTVFEVRQK